jgi:hypothetical protein
VVEFHTSLSDQVVGTGVEDIDEDDDINIDSSSLIKDIPVQEPVDQDVSSGSILAHSPGQHGVWSFPLGILQI